ncbi:MAG TPA: SIS domain-containing protein [Anaerolineae bacterium]|nr:SIS domain-containing protein [Anaerolineae bacterium]
MSNKAQARNPWTDPYNDEMISLQARLVHEVIRRLEPQVEQVITPELAGQLEKIYLTGCGDSHYAGVAARLAFDKYSGVQTEPLESLEFSRYVVDYAPNNSLVIGISNSGQVSRSIETLVLARKRKLHTIAITGYSDGPLARAAAASLIQSVPDMAEDWGPYSMGSLGLGNFIASLLTLYLSALRIGELRGKVSSAQVAALKRELVGAADIIARTAEADAKTARELAIAFWHLHTFYILGGGPNYATAMFGAAKLFEQPHQNGVAQELEEWAHEQYFLTRPNVAPIFILAPPGNSRDRAMEQMRGARDMGGTVVAICDAEDTEVLQLAQYALPIYGTLREEFSPLAYIVPTELFATNLHQVKGRPPLIPPFGQEQLMQVNYRQIFHSKIWGQ